ncbi:MAG: hypothetical protein R2939_00465 [Kofleriaceae bacterium]
MNASRSLLFVSLLAATACGDGGSTPIDAPQPDAAPTADGAPTADATPAVDAAPDAMPPMIDPVTDLTATPGAAGGVDLAWTNPDDANLAGVLVVARHGAAVAFTPTNGTAYTVGQDLADDQRVRSIATVTSLAAVPALAAVPEHVAAWAFTADHVYSTIAVADAITNLLGTQRGTLTIALDNTVTITQPDGLTLSATATYDDGTDSIAVDLGARNDTGRLLFNLKGLIDDTNQGTASALSTFPTAIGRPVIYFGPEATDVGATPQRAFTLDGIDGSVDPVVVDLEFLDHRAAFVPTDGAVGVLDTSGSGFGGTASLAGTGFRARVRGLAVSADGRRLAVGSKSGPFLSVFDTTTLARTVSVDLSTNGLGIGAVTAVAFSPDQTKLWVLLSDNRHANNGSGGEAVPAAVITLVELDATTLAEIQRIAAPSTTTPPRDLAVAADGSFAAISIYANNGIWLVDLAAFAFIDGDAGAGGVQPLSLPAGLGERIAISADGATVGGLDRSGQTVTTIDTATLTVTQTASVGNGRQYGATFLANGDLITLTRATDSGVLLRRNDGVAETTLMMNPGVDVRGGLIDEASGSVLLYSTSDDLFRFALADGAAIDLDGDPDNLAVGVGMPFETHRHGNVLSPF